MSSGRRVQQGNYTEADVLVLYMKYREAGLGPFTREVGDFIAHAKRNRGATLDVTAYMFSQFAFFQTYQSDKKKPLEPRGNCGWWLRHYLLTKAKDASEREIREASGLTKKQAKNAIKSWFHRDSVYPTNINCGDPDLLYKLVSLFCQTIEGKNVFDLAQVKSELLNMFQHEGIEEAEVERFLVATAILLKGKSVEIVPGFTASIELSVRNTRYVTVEDYSAEKGYQLVRPLPDGNLTVDVSTKNKTGDGLVTIALDLLDTQIDTEPYFSRLLVKNDQYGMPKLALDQHLSFDSQVSPHVS